MTTNMLMTIDIYHDDGWGLRLREIDTGVELSYINNNVEAVLDVSELILDDVIIALQTFQNRRGLDNE